MIKSTMSKPENAEFLWLLRLIISTAAAAVAAAAAESEASTVKPNCQAQCGDVSIPYPFGIGPGCYLEGFDVRCNTTFRPPRPFLGNTDTGAELIDISLLAGEARVYKQIDWVCYNQTTYYGYDFITINLTTRPVYRFSTRNTLTSVGCRTAAYVGGDSNVGALYLSACVSICDVLETVENDTCTGWGCCQTALPSGLRSVFTTIDPTRINNTAVWQFNPCSYSFVVEEGRYNFTSGDLIAGHLNSTHQRGMPVVVDWAIRNQTCKAARLNQTSFACVAKNSECVDSRDGPGYICNCTSGYEGNPYLENGCQDIDECKLPSEYPCYGDCINTIGSHNCSCPPGKVGDPTTKDGCRSTNGSSFPLALKVLIASMSSVIFLTIMSFGMYLGLQKRKLIRLKQRFFEQNGGLILQQQMNSSQAATFKLFTQEELERATDKFDDKLIIGRGGHGVVYKGTLDDKRVVAIKKSKMLDEGQTKEFAKEMLILSQINHRNVIKILGCCLEVEVPMLVYEFIPNGNVYEYLHDDITIPLDARLRIAEESASAIAYLHSAASPPIIHGDVKSSNILLDEEFSAKVSDFGASKLAPKNEAQLATVVQGTCGYLDPEYLLTCQLTEKSDVYSFGVVILELLTRVKPFGFDASTSEEKCLASVFLAAMKQDDFADLLDSELRVEADLVLIKEAAQIAVRCLNFAGDERPTMKEVAESLGKLRKHNKHNDPDTLPYSQYVNPGPRPRSYTSNTESFDAHDASGSNTAALEIISLLDVGLGR